jgi:hypothetical protein
MKTYKEDILQSLEERSRESDAVSENVCESDEEHKIKINQNEITRSRA